MKSKGGEIPRFVDSETGVYETISFQSTLPGLAPVTNQLDVIKTEAGRIGLPYFAHEALAAELGQPQLERAVMWLPKNIDVEEQVGSLGGVADPNSLSALLAINDRIQGEFDIPVMRTPQNEAGFYVQDLFADVPAKFKSQMLSVFWLFTKHNVRSSDKPEVHKLNKEDIRALQEARVAGAQGGEFTSGYVILDNE